MAADEADQLFAMMTMVTTAANDIMFLNTSTTTYRLPHHPIGNVPAVDITSSLMDFSIIATITIAICIIEWNPT